MARVICTFNVNNLHARYRFGDTDPGDKATRRQGQEERGRGGVGV